MFADEASVVVGEDENVFVTLTHKPFFVGGDSISNYELTVVEDYKTHFPDFDLLLKVLCAARFANDRRQAFIWLHVVSNWGKGLLQAIFEEIGIVVELSVKEIEAALEGKPLGREASDFLRAWILWIDEFKAAKSEIKQLNRKISGSPKNQLNFEAPVYLKMFTSAENVDSLAGDKGVEDQFVSRFSYLNPKPSDNDLRVLFMQNKGKYKHALAKYVARELNLFVSGMKALGREESASCCDKILTQFNKEYNIGIRFGKLNDSVKEVADEIKEILIKHARAPLELTTIGQLPDKLPRHLRELLKAYQHPKPCMRQTTVNLLLRI